MRVLVATATRHDATHEIGAEIGRVLTDALPPARFSVEVKDAADVDDIDEFDAAVVGSAVYVGHWLEPARDLANKLTEREPSLPLWMFSSGPVGDPPKPEGIPADISELLAEPSVVEHAVFAGRMDKKNLKFSERAVAAVVHSPMGDFRDWDEIRQWATTIATELNES